MNRALDQFFTPSWAAEMIVRRHFADLGPRDCVAEPSCGDGRFLMAIPREVDAYGVEIDPIAAAAAVKNTGREVIVGNFMSAKLPRRPTVVLGNPPFSAEVIDGFIERCYHELDYGGRIGFLLPVYMFQTASRVVGYQRRWSISQELVPRNLFERLSCPLMFARFTKERQTVISGLFLYAETDAIASLKADIRTLVLGNDSTAHCWRDVVRLALEALGGRATLNQLYLAIENNRPTENKWWREKVRQIAGTYFVRVAAGEYALEAA
jgi:adenine-specific DNA-methyltransferase